MANASKSAVDTFYVYLVFLVCYLPHSFSLAFIALHGSNAQTKVSTIYTWTLVLFNSSLNPIIYCWKLRPIRRAVMDILRNIPSQLMKLRVQPETLYWLDYTKHKSLLNLMSFFKPIRFVIQHFKQLVRSFERTWVDHSRVPLLLRCSFVCLRN